MTRFADLLRLDWEAIGQRALLAAAESLAQAARRRADAAPDAISIHVLRDDYAKIMADTVLTQREIGSAATLPRPFLAPSAHDLAEARRAIEDSLHKDIR